MSIAQVALDTPVAQTFDYLIPPGVTLTEQDIGRRVEVPFGRRRCWGVVVGLAERSSLPSEQLKCILSVDVLTPALPRSLLELARFAAQYYQHPLGAVLLGMIPPQLRRRAAVRGPTPAAYALTPAGVAAIAHLPRHARAQRRLAERLAAGPVDAAQLSELRTPLRQWLARGWVAPLDAAGDAVPAAEPAPALNAHQAAAVREILAAAGRFGVWLLHGVTGSGKTEVYLRLIEASLAGGRQALVLVPEIHLTPQLIERFRRRLPQARLVSLHSGLNAGERAAQWRDCLTGRADVVLGTRLAVFAPLERPGLIVVDEEHDPSYKQTEGLRYHARDLAIWRARQCGVPVVLGSATPALETWLNAHTGRYRRLDLPLRAGAAVLPQIRLIDTRTDRPQQGLTRGLLTALGDTLARGEQSLVFINRRGYAPTLFCNACGHVLGCPRCSAHLVLHRAGGAYRLQCHYCGLVRPPPPSCPECGALDLRPSGQGTQRLEETLAGHFPQARILRVDRDSMARRGRFEAVRAAVHAGEVDILVGTQILAKGHDFPRLTLVGVVGADAALLAADYRAGERLFAQLMQVAGRAGRAGQPGTVLVQTAFAAHPLYQALVRHDYAGWAARALRERREAGFPPYVRQALLRAEARSEEAVRAFLQAARAAALEEAEGVMVFDPAPALVARVAERARWQLLLQSRSRRRLQAFLPPWLARLRALPARGVRWALDVDPIAL
ncbi:MAG: primosomal protein N' [Thiobacillaceae bacterium]|nr:primosomal protein N' [Thiobacillaceae bacterium]